MIRPNSEEELAGIVAGAKRALSIQGGGTRGFADNATGERLTSAAITGITLYEPGALTLVARAGTPVEEIRERLAKDNQRLPFEPMDHRALLGTTGEPTIGGVVAANVSGPRRVMVGAARDYVLGLRFVDGRGTVIRNGGRVMKNVTGYDLPKLLTGSYGTLAALTSVILKVLPAPETEETVVLTGLGEVFTDASEYFHIPGMKQIFYGLALLVIVIYRPAGVWPWLAERLGFGERRR